jgi:Cellulase (glycosyl hydrolase family 5)
VSGAPTDGQVQRPSYNSGNGFFVYDGKLYDPNGNEFRLRGVNRCHFDVDSQPGISNSHANAVRVFMYKLSYGAAPYADDIKTQHIDYNEVPILSMPQFPDGTETTGNQSTSELASGVAWWVANAATFTPLNKYLIVNIANEWGPKDSTVWRDAYISAVASMRAAGYLGPLLIDAGGSGQDELDISNYAAAVLASDPQKNLIFAYHVYGATSTIQVPLASVSGKVITLSNSAATHPFAPTFDGTNNSYSGITIVVIRSPSGELTTVPVLPNVGGKPGAWTITATEEVPEVAAGSTVYDWGNYQMRIPRLAALASQNIMVAITEFGPGNDIGPSPTMVTPGDVIGTAESSGIGWLAWAWDDNDLSDGRSNNQWFSMTNTGPGIYVDSSNLTEFGQEVVLNPTYGLSVLAKPASIFD